ncbi:MAG: hypothetical protein IMF10_09285 [Proteobacteria bacterium]|nr:hypothetical protein [Pseudomonadota bacterium]
MNKIFPKLPGYPEHMSIARKNKDKGLLGYARIAHRDKNGKIIWENAAALINQGEEHMLKGWVQAVANSIPSSFKVNLVTDVAIAEDATTFTVVTGTGYAEVSVAHDATDWTYGTDAGDSKVTTKDCVFTASGADWTTAKKVVLEAVLNSVDTLIAYADLSQDRTVGNGESLTVSIILKLS